MTDPVSGFTFTLVSRIDYIAKMAAIIAGLEVFEEAATGATADELVELIQKYAPEDLCALKESVKTLLNLKNAVQTVINGYDEDDVSDVDYRHRDTAPNSVTGY